MSLRKRLWPNIPDDLWYNPKWQLKNRLKGISGLKILSFLKDNTGQYEALLKRYKWASTPYYLNLIKSIDFNDPISLQVLPNPKEISASSNDSSPDPLNEKEFSPVPFLIHRYPDRAVVIANNFCASYCRHCNRKRNWGIPKFQVTQKDFERITGYLSSKKEIREVLISGGDPLLLPLKKLETILSNIKRCPNIDVIRIGTRVPVTFPMGITNELCALLKRFRPLWLNTHFNHPREITQESSEAIEKITLSGIPVSNQTVLLKGVNDDIKTLKELFYRLQAIMVRPYYLFQCDHVTGTNHFRVDLKKGIKIMNKLWGRIGGMCLPNFVFDLPGGYGKTRLLPSQLLDYENGIAVFSTFEGKITKVKIS